MTSVPVPAAAISDRPTAEGERALRQALGYIATADALSTRRVYAADRGTSTFGACTRVLLVRGELPARGHRLSSAAPDRVG